MIHSGARGNMLQLRQISAIRGLVANPKGEIIPRPIKSSFREGLSVLEYFISTHGAREGSRGHRAADRRLGLPDPASGGRLAGRDHPRGGLRHRARHHDDGVPSTARTARCRMHEHAEIRRASAARVAGRRQGRQRSIVVPRLNDRAATDLTSILVGDMVAAGIETVRVRSVLTCESKLGVCAACYGRSAADRQASSTLARRSASSRAVRSVEPGTQLTMRTFHHRWRRRVSDITGGLPRVQETVEARVPEGQGARSPTPCGSRAPRGGRAFSQDHHRPRRWRRRDRVYDKISPSA